MAATLALATLGLLAAGGVGAGLAPAGDTPEPTQLVPFEKLANEFEGHKAFTRPCKDASVGFSVPSQVKEVLATAGQVVKKGDLLIRGDDEEDAALLRLQEIRAKSKATVAKEKASVELAQLEYDRLIEASSKGAGNPQEMDRARLGLAAAKANLEIAEVTQEQEELEVERRRARVERLRLTAPFDGVVDTVLVDLGQSLQESEKAIRIVDIDPLWLDVDTPTDETVRRRTKPGDEAWILIDLAGKAEVVKGKVIEVSPTADASSRTRKVRIEVPNPEGAAGEGMRLVAGEPAWVRFAAPSKDWTARAENPRSARADGAEASR